MPNLKVIFWSANSALANQHPLIAIVGCYQLSACNIDVHVEGGAICTHSAKSPIDDIVTPSPKLYRLRLGFLTTVWWPPALFYKRTPVVASLMHCLAENKGLLRVASLASRKFKNQL